MNHWKLRIIFAEKNEVGILDLLKPILTEAEFFNVPKLVICQICRGSYMNVTAFDSSESSDVKKSRKMVNGQDIVEHFLLIFQKS